MKIDKKLLTTLASGVITSIAPAATITADVADAQPRSDGGVGQSNNTTMFSGAYYGAGPGLVPVFPFLLPTLGAGESFDSATITLELASKFSNPTSFNGDIVGLNRIDASPTVLGADWGASGSMLHDDFYTPASPTGVSTSNDFTAWLNTQYAGGANAGNYVFIRVDAEGHSSGAEAFLVASANHGTLQKPTITYTASAVPEPSSTALLGLSCLALILRRRK